MNLKIKPVKSNMTELHLGNIPTHGDVILFSYETPVAAYTVKDGWIRTDVYYSRTTSKHINQWAGKGAKVVPQTYIDNLVKGA